jgi:hypothetical protein
MPVMDVRADDVPGLPGYSGRAGFKGNFSNGGVNNRGVAASPLSVPRVPGRREAHGTSMATSMYYRA